MPIAISQEIAPNYKIILQIYKKLLSKTFLLTIYCVIIFP